MKEVVIGRGEATKQSGVFESLDCLASLAMPFSVRIEKDAGDDEQCRHRQHVRECFRGRPLGGFLHAGLSLNLGATSRGAADAHNRQNFHSEHPTPTSSTRLTVVPTQRISTIRRSDSNEAAI